MAGDVTGSKAGLKKAGLKKAGLKTRLYEAFCPWVRRRCEFTT